MQPNVSAILLAAGQSRRMGRSKQLLPLPDRPVIVRCVETILAAGIVDVIVVVGSQAEEMARAVEGFPVAVVPNEDQESDMAGSVRIGLSALDQNSEGVFICLCDHPLVSPRTLAMMSMHHEESPGSIIIPCCKGLKGHPTFFPRLLLEEIETLPTLRDIIGRHGDKVHLLDTDDEGAVLDMDTWEDYQRMLDLL